MKNKTDKKQRTLIQPTMVNPIGANTSAINEVRLEGIMGAIMDGCAPTTQIEKDTTTANTPVSFSK